MKLVLLLMPVALAFATPSRAADAECAVLEAVAREIIVRGDLVVAATQLDYAAFAEELASSGPALGLSPKQAAAGAAVRAADEYQPDCWPGPVEVGRYQTRVAFIRPLFLEPDLVILGLRQDGYASGGTWTCAVRRVTGDWRAVCRQTLVWAR